MSTNGIADSLNDLSLKTDIAAPKKSPKSKASYDKVALRERWKILGTDAEQSKLLRRWLAQINRYNSL